MQLRLQQQDDAWVDSGPTYSLVASAEYGPFWADADRQVVNQTEG
jgi:hypothetical protein